MQQRKKLLAKRLLKFTRRTETLPREVYILSGVSFFVAVGFGLIVPAIPLFAQTFGVNKTAVGFIISTFALARFGSGLISGKLVDRFGERVILGTGLFFVAISSLLSGLAQSYWQLLVFRSAGGLGSSMFSVAASALLMRSVSDNQLGRAQSMYNSGFLIGGIAGPSFGGLLTGISLRAPFFVYAITLTCGGILTFFALNEKRLGSKGSGKQDPLDRILIRDALKNFPYRSALAFAFLINWVLFGMRNSILPLFVRDKLHGSPSIIGYGFTLSAIAQALILMYAGCQSDFRGRRFVILVGSSFLTLGVGTLVIANAEWYYFLAMVIFGLGGAFMGTGHANIVGDVFKGKGGQVVAVWQMAGDAGMIVSPILLGFLSDRYSYHTALVVTMGVAAIAFVLALYLPETRTQDEEVLK
jgi:MFS family permease